MRAKTFNQWINESDKPSPWFLPISEFIAYLAGQQHEASVDPQTGEITIEDEWTVDNDDLDWPNHGDTFYRTNTLLLTPVFNEISPDLEQLYRVQAKKNPEDFLDELVGFEVTTRAAFSSEDVSLDYSDVSRDGLVDFTVGSDEDFEVEFEDFINDYLSSFGIETIPGDGDQLKSILQDSFPWAYEESEEDDEFDEEFDDEDEDWEE